MWTDSAESAARFVDWAFDRGASDGARLITGTIEGTADPALEPKPLDTQTWSVLALPDKNIHFSSGINWAMKNCRVIRNGLSGFGFSTVSKDIWPEGTAQMALAYYSLGRRDQYWVIATELSRLQHAFAAEQTDSRGAVPAAAFDKVETGYRDILYWHLPHIGATSWTILMQMRFNPFCGNVLG